MILQNDWYCSCANTNSMNVTSSPHAACIFLDFFFFFMCRWPQNYPRPVQFSWGFEPLSWWEWSEIAYFWGLRRPLERGSLMSRGGGAIGGLGVTRFARPAFYCSPAYWLIVTTVWLILTESASAPALEITLYHVYNFYLRRRRLKLVPGNFCGDSVFCFPIYKRVVFPFSFIRVIVSIFLLIRGVLYTWGTEQLEETASLRFVQR